jgi:hypothetical protein
MRRHYKLGAGSGKKSEFIGKRSRRLDAATFSGQ